MASQVFGGPPTADRRPQAVQAAQADGFEGADHMSVHASEASLFLAPTSPHGSRRDLLLPGLRAPAGLSAAVGAAAGAVAGVLLQDGPDGPWVLLTAAGAACGVSAALFAAGGVVAAASAAETVLCWLGVTRMCSPSLCCGRWGAWARRPPPVRCSLSRHRRSACC
ncbi:hypothetical protein [Streptomyces montanisoli]|uniref:Uncharacterized protein n=1 Tax=Streptomyces montanisoli TaxID=2798581 RepID=A0A940MHM4_9ACTN|nr:hypothetical protein [Streptomyces montanisoli]MBP0461252.1 hypothetical protein [Streptomyces montanisoli]